MDVFDLVWSTRRASTGQDPGAWVSGIEFSIKEMVIEFGKVYFDGLEAIGSH